MQGQRTDVNLLYQHFDHELAIKTYRLKQSNMSDRHAVILDCIDAAAVKEV